MQVVTNENMLELIQTGKVAEYEPPTPPRDEATGQFKADDAAKPAEVDTTDKTGDKGAAEPEKATETKADDQPAKVEADDESDEDLPEKVRKKIGAKHRQMKEAEEFAEREFDKRKAAERRAAELETELSTLKSKSGPAQDGKTGDEPAEPNPDDFKTVAEYARAVIKYEKALDAKANAKEAAESSVQTERERLGAAFKKQEAEVIAANPDYQAVVAKFDPTDLPGHIPQYLIESGPLLTYHFAKLPFMERNRIAQLSPIRAIAELGKLEAKLDKPAEKQEESAKQPAISKAPSPITPLSADGTVPVNKDPATMTFKELREYERQREAASRRR